MLLKQIKTLRREEIDFMQSYGLGVILQAAMGEGVAFMSFIVTLGALNVFEG